MVATKAADCATFGLNRPRMFMADLTALRAEFSERFGGQASLFQAPGRVNLIGEHTDYNAGFVMPAAIKFHATVAIAPRTDRNLRVRSTNFAETVQVKMPELGSIARRPPGTVHWVDYVMGVAAALQHQGVPLSGADVLIHGEVPLGAGLSSSAALEVALALALSETAGTTLTKLLLAQLCQQAENDYVGLRCGIMDQFASSCGRAGHALMIDCRSLEHRLLPLQAPSMDGGSDLQLVVCNTMVRHQLAGGEYNRRRAECEEGVKQLARAAPEIETLRDVTPELLQAQRPSMDSVIYRRCRHIVSENWRVQAAAAALERADLSAFGRLMGQSHNSLRDDYEVSCDELDLLVRLAQPLDGVYGARMTGGGFGGCTVNLVRADAVGDFKFRIAAEYKAATGLTPDIWICEADDGASRIHD